VGDSAGGNLAAVVTLRALELGITEPSGVVMIYPALYLHMTPCPSRVLSLMDPLLPLGTLQLCMTSYAQRFQVSVCGSGFRLHELIRPAHAGLISAACARSALLLSAPMHAHHLSAWRPRACRRAEKRERQERHGHVTAALHKHFIETEEGPDTPPVPEPFQGTYTILLFIHLFVYLFYRAICCRWDATNTQTQTHTQHTHNTHTHTHTHTHAHTHIADEDSVVACGNGCEAEGAGDWEATHWCQECQLPICSVCVMMHRRQVARVPRAPPLHFCVRSLESFEALWPVAAGGDATAWSGRGEEKLTGEQELMGEQELTGEDEVSRS
jgi:hypothetical protein